MPVLVRCRLSLVRLFRARIETLAQAVVAAAGDPDAELSLLLVGDRRMRRLNCEYRRKDKTTDVLAFPMREADGPASSLLGDVVIALPQAARQAKAGGHSLDHELAVLLVHGILHLFGYDHERGEREAMRMRRKERAILRRLEPLPKLVRREG
ncbi:MAG: rRNA maturation RNase YbeY [Nitrospirae bacterium]|nr:MAG: rRNA maturation RNase YbeY [Nitrospirota bacterium]